MPKKGLFDRKNSVTRHYRIHKGINKALMRESKLSNKTITALVNYTLAEKYAPEIIQDLESWTSKPRYQYPSRKKAKL